MDEGVGGDDTGVGGDRASFGGYLAFVGGDGACVGGYINRGLVGMELVLKGSELVWIEVVLEKMNLVSSLCCRGWS